MWSVAPLIATAAAVTNGVGWAVIPVFMSGLSPFLIFVASFLSKKAYWKPSTFDYICGIMSVLALLLWFLTHDPNLAITLAIVSDAFAAVPTVTKAWRNPKTESAWPFIIGTFTPLTSFLAATVWTFSELAFPVYLVMVNVVFVFSVSKKWMPKN
jgi:hypothetical protein